MGLTDPIQTLSHALFWGNSAYKVPAKLEKFFLQEFLHLAALCKVEYFCTTQRKKELGDRGFPVGLA